MLVKNYMTRHPVFIEPKKRLVDAQKVLTESKIRHLPVVTDGKRLIGLVSRERMQISPERLTSLEVWEITRLLADLTVEQIMVKGPDLHTIHPEATLEDAAALLIKHKIGGMPVVEDGLLVGMITETDLLVELQELLGAYDSGWRITMRVPNRSGEFSKLAGAILENGWGIMSMGSVRTPKDPDHWDIVLKVRNCTKEQIMPVLESIPDQVIIDARETSPLD